MISGAILRHHNPGLLEDDGIASNRLKPITSGYRYENQRLISTILIAKPIRTVRATNVPLTASVPPVLASKIVLRLSGSVSESTPMIRLKWLRRTRGWPGRLRYPKFDDRCRVPCGWWMSYGRHLGVEAVSWQILPMKKKRPVRRRETAGAMRDLTSPRWWMSAGCSTTPPTRPSTWPRIETLEFTGKGVGAQPVEQAVESNSTTTARPRGGRRRRNARRERPARYARKSTRFCRATIVIADLLPLWMVVFANAEQQQQGAWRNDAVVISNELEDHRNQIDDAEAAHHGRQRRVGRVGGVRLAVASAADCILRRRCHLLEAGKPRSQSLITCVPRRRWRDGHECLRGDLRFVRVSRSAPASTEAGIDADERSPTRLPPSSSRTDAGVRAQQRAAREAVWLSR